MGIFNKKRKEINNKQIEKGTNRDSFYMTPISNQGDMIAIYGIKKDRGVMYKDGTETDLMNAKILIYKKGDCIILDLGDNIAFEIPKGYSINYKDSNIMESIVNAYLNEKDSKERKECVYLGKYIQNQYGSQFGQKSASIDNYVKGKLSTKIREEIEKKIQENKAKGNRNEKGLRERIAVRISDLNQIRERRKQNPKLNFLKKYEIENRYYEDYNGTNIRNGDILRVRKLDKIGKDGSGTYLYSGYISNTFNESDVEILDKNNPMGNFVCFELPKRLEDIVRNNNQEEINLVLELLSEYRNFENSKILKYIGGIDKNGRIQRNSKSDSQSIQMIIEKMQKDYKEKNDIRDSEYTQ